MTGVDHRARQSRPNIRFRQVGRPLTRTDAPGKVTGRTPYAGDYVMPGMLHMRVVRADIASARLVRLDVSKARALEGVACVLTAADLPDRTASTDIPGQTGRKRLDTGQQILVRERVRYFGEPLALIAAETRDIADHAMELVEFELEPIPGVYDPLEAMKPGAPSSPSPTTSWPSAGSGRGTSRRASPRPTSWSRTRSAPRSRSMPSSSPRWGSRGWTRTTWSTFASPPR